LKINFIHQLVQTSFVFTSCQLVEFKENTDQYISKVATTVDEATN